KELTIAKNGKSLGIEHANDEAIREALAMVYTTETERIETITIQQLMEAKLLGHPNARDRRERIAAHLRIGQVNGKGLKKRLEMFRISQEQLQEAIRMLDEED